MSPEYSIVPDSKGRSEIKTTPLIGDSNEIFMKASRIGSVANSYIKSKYFENAVKKLEEILPEDISRKLVLAVQKNLVGKRILFQVNEIGKTKIKDSNIL